MGDFVLVSVFCWNLFFTKTKFHNRYLLLKLLPPHTNSTMISPVGTITKGSKEEKRIKTKTRMGSVVKKNVGEMEDNTRDGINSKIRKEGV